MEFKMLFIWEKHKRNLLFPKIIVSLVTFSTTLTLSTTHFPFSLLYALIHLLLVAVPGENVA